MNTAAGSKEDTQVTTQNKESMSILITALTVTCIVGVIGLSLTYTTTKETIAATTAREQNETIKKVLPAFEGTITEKKITVGDQKISFFIAQKNSTVIGVATIATEAGYGGELKVMVGILPDNSIYGVELLQHQETPGLGAKASEDKFKSQFKGKRSRSPNEPLMVIKAGEKAVAANRTINAITAATITSKAFTKAVNKALISFQANKQELLKNTRTI